MSIIRVTPSSRLRLIRNFPYIVDLQRRNIIDPTTMELADNSRIGEHHTCVLETIGLNFIVKRKIGIEKYKIDLTGVWIGFDIVRKDHYVRTASVDCFAFRHEADAFMFKMSL